MANLGAKKMNNDNHNGGPTIVLVFLAALFVGVFAVIEWLDTNKATELNAAAEYLRSPDTQKWADSKSLAEEWLGDIKRGADK